MKHIEVVAAIIQHQNQTLCVQRNESKYDYISKKFEFPGGKVEAGESKEDAIIREIKEELDMDVSIVQHFLTVEHHYPDFSITMHSFLCSSPNRDLTLTEHISYQWLSWEELESLDWAAADVPIVKQLIKAV